MSPQAEQNSAGTLGDVLYPDKDRVREPEESWAALVRAVAEGDQLALHALYERAYRVVYTVILRITGNAATAEELTVDVFHDVWRRAPEYDPEHGTVLGWIMNQARSRAIDRLRFDQRKKRTSPAEGEGHQAESEAAPSADHVELRQQRDRLQRALTTLNPEERQAIETTFFCDLTHMEAATRLDQPLGTVKTRIRSALHKLRQALAAEARTP